jgi:hypothetical protein
VQDKAPARLDRTAVQDRPIRRLTRIQAQLLKQSSDPDSRALVTDADSDGTIFVVNAHHDHCVFKTRVTNAGHSQQQLARKKARTVHMATMRPSSIGCK